MARSERLLQLIQVLRRHRAPVSAQVLAGETHVSIRSVYRDIQALRAQGASIDGEAGIGYVLRPGFLLPPLMFSDEELEALVLGLRLAAAHADEELGRAATEVVAKLRAVLPRDLRALVDEVALLAAPVSRRPPENVDLRDIRHTLRRNRKARIRYADKRGATSERIIWPLGLAFFERVRVVVAWCESRQDFRTFRTDRMASWETLKEPVGRPRMVMLREWREREQIPPPL